MPTCRLKLHRVRRPLAGDLFGRDPPPKKSGNLKLPRLKLPNSPEADDAAAIVVDELPLEAADDADDDETSEPSED